MQAAGMHQTTQSVPFINVHQTSLVIWEGPGVRLHQTTVITNNVASMPEKCMECSKVLWTGG